MLGLYVSKYDRGVGPVWPGCEADESAYYQDQLCEKTAATDGQRGRRRAKKGKETKKKDCIW